MISTPPRSPSSVTICLLCAHMAVSRSSPSAQAPASSAAATPKACAAAKPGPSASDIDSAFKARAACLLANSSRSRFGEHPGRRCNKVLLCTRLCCVLQGGALAETSTAASRQKEGPAPAAVAADPIVAAADATTGAQNSSAQGPEARAGVPEEAPDRPELQGSPIKSGQEQVQQVEAQSADASPAKPAGVEDQAAPAPRTEQQAAAPAPPAAAPNASQQQQQQQEQAGGLTAGLPG